MTGWSLRRFGPVLQQKLNSISLTLNFHLLEGWPFGLWFINFIGIFPVNGGVLLCTQINLNLFDFRICQTLNYVGHKFLAHAVAQASETVSMSFVEIVAVILVECQLWKRFLTEHEAFPGLASNLMRG